jgi:hypothetical protein
MTTSKLMLPALTFSARSSRPTTSAPAAGRSAFGALREHRDAHRLAGAVRQHGGTAHLLVGLARVDAEVHGDVDDSSNLARGRIP